MQPDQRLYRGTRIPAAIEGLAAVRAWPLWPVGGGAARWGRCGAATVFANSAISEKVQPDNDCNAVWYIDTMQLGPPRASTRAVERTVMGKASDPDFRGRWRRFNVPAVPYSSECDVDRRRCAGYQPRPRCEKRQGHGAAGPPQREW